MEQQDRYSRHFRLPGFTKNIQTRLLNSKIVIIGAGGLGIPALQYLAGAGIGSIIIIDDDNVSLSNLHRQVIYTETDIGKPKAALAKDFIMNLNSGIKVKAIKDRLNEINIGKLIPTDTDLIIDASDNFETRYTIDDYCSKLAIPLIYGAIHRFEGHIGVFHFSSGISYRSLFPKAPEPGLVDNCEINGVLGPVAGTIGCLMANEAIKLLSGLGKVLSGELLVIKFDDFSVIRMKLHGENQFSLSGNENNYTIENISADKLINKLKTEKNIQLIDIRHPIEFAKNNIPGSVNVPISKLKLHIETIPTDNIVVLICEIGMSSADQIRNLQERNGFPNLLNLKGGIRDWFKTKNP